MDIKFTILNILNDAPHSGYDMKKIVQELSFLPWSGNNNQIYKALLALTAQLLVTNEVIHQESAPSKKVYRITAAGTEALEQELRAFIPDPVGMKNSFLIWLSGCRTLTNADIQQKAADYEDELIHQKEGYMEEMRRRRHFPDRSDREIYCWNMIYENMITACDSELHWLREFREGLKNYDH